MLGSLNLSQTLTSPQFATGGSRVTQISDKWHNFSTQHSGIASPRNPHFGEGAVTERVRAKAIHIATMKSLISPSHNNVSADYIQFLKNTAELELNTTKQNRPGSPAISSQIISNRRPSTISSRPMTASATHRVLQKQSMINYQMNMYYFVCFFYFNLFFLFFIFMSQKKK